MRDFLPHHAHGRFDVLDEAECRRLLPASPIGRVAFDSALGLQLLPVNFRTDGRVILFATSPQSVLAELLEPRDGIVFETDFHDDVFETGWSIVARGSSSTATDPDELALLEKHPRLDPWAAGDRREIVRIEIAEMSGRKVKQH